MGNYSSLKATINANIKTNGNQEITGSVLNSVLNAMVDSEGAGYQFMGVATPSSPGTAQTPDYKCFYLASTPGTYTYLGGLVVADGEVAILKYDTAWSKEVTGAASAADLSQLGQKVSELEPKVEDNSENIVNLQQEIDNINPIVIEGNVTNAPDEEDLTTDDNDLLKFANRSTAVNQKGYKILRKSATFAAQVTDTNTIYEIRYPFDLGGASVTIPAGCVLKFVGGQLRNGTIAGQDTSIEWAGSAIFSGIAISGTWASSAYDAKMFADVENENVLQQAVNLCKGDGQSVLAIGSDLVCLVSVSENEESAIAVPANTTILLDGTIQLKANSLWGYKILYIAEDNVTIKGVGKVWGDYTKGHDFSTYQGEGHDTHEWGRGVAIWGAKNVTIEGIESGYCTGDAFNVGQSCEDIRLTGIYGHTSRRQGLTIGSNINLLVNDFVFENILGTDPQAGIDIEPDSGDVRNVTICNGVIKGAMWGINTYCKASNDGEYKNINISNVHIESVSEAIGGASASDSIIEFSVRNLTYTKVSRMLFFAQTNIHLNIDGVTEIYDTTDENDDFPAILANIRSAESKVKLSHFNGRCRTYLFASAGNGSFVITDSDMLCYDPKGSSYDGILGQMELVIERTNFKYEGGTGRQMQLMAAPCLIQDCTFDVAGIYIGTAATSDNYGVMLLRNYIKTSGDGQSQGIQVQPRSGKSRGSFISNIINHTGTGFAIVMQNDTLYNFVDNEIAIPNSTSHSIFNNAPTKWNLIERGLKKGTTANRPTLFTSIGWITKDEGYQYFDTTLRRPVWWRGSGFVDALGIVNDANVTAFRGTTDTRTAMTLTSTNAGLLFYDETLKAWTLWNGSAWTYADGEPILAKSGTTRPTGSARIGYEFFDETLGKPIWYKGNSQWVDATGTEV